MGFRLNAIFITNQGSTSNEEILIKLGLTNLNKGNSVDFFGTNKKWYSTFIGTYGDCKIICNGKLASEAFDIKNPFLNFKESEIASIIWNETADLYGFSLIKNGKIIRKIMTVQEDTMTGFGLPIEEELVLKEEELLSKEDVEEIIETEGEEMLKKIIESERIAQAADNLVQRYLGTSLSNINQEIELLEYK